MRIMTTPRTKSIDVMREVASFGDPGAAVS
jgi:hypothetical protein